MAPMDGILIVSKRLNGKLDRTVNKEHWAVDLTFMQLLAYSHLIHERMDCHHRSSNVQIEWALCSIFVIKSLKLPLILNAFALLTLAFMHSVLVRVAAHTHFSPQPALNRQIHYQRLSYPRPSTFNKKKEKILRSLFIRCQLNTHTHTHHVHQPKKLPGKLTITNAKWNAHLKSVFVRYIAIKRMYFELGWVLYRTYVRFLIRLFTFRQFHSFY